ncbi:hypothetical protein B0H14DRAFT_2585381 [Mycena olivaceomarginata]|nr:hypothetical protein B0H14DRAFT_2585381 [Mycena olivaceomarginata]
MRKGREGAYRDAHGYAASPIGQVFSSASSEYDSDGEVLPLASTHQDGRASPGGHPPWAQNGGAAGEGAGAAVGEDGKWFQALDEQYLLLLLNATGSRAFHARGAEGSAGPSVAGSAGPSVAGSAGPSVAGSDNEADVAGGEDEDIVELGCHSSNGCRGAQGRRLERGSASPVLRSNGSGEQLGEHRECADAPAPPRTTPHARRRGRSDRGGRTRTRCRLVLGLLDDLRCAHTHAPQRQSPSLGTRVRIRAAVADLTRHIIVCMHAHPCLPADAPHRVCGELHFVACNAQCTMDVRAEAPPPYVHTARSKPLARVMCNSKPAKQLSPEWLFTLAYTTALSGMHGDEHEHERLRATGIPGASRPASGLPTTRAAGLRH